MKQNNDKLNTSVEVTTSVIMSKNTCTEEVMESIVHVGTLYDTLQKYVLVEWPEIQTFMDHPRWSECIFCMEIEGHPCPDNSYMVPESLYKEVNNGMVN